MNNKKHIWTAYGLMIFGVWAFANFASNIIFGVNLTPVVLKALLHPILGLVWFAIAIFILKKASVAKNVLFTLILFAVLTPTFAIGATITSSIVQGKTPSEAILILAEQLDLIEARVMTLEKQTEEFDNELNSITKTLYCTELRKNTPKNGPINFLNRDIVGYRNSVQKTYEELPAHLEQMGDYEMANEESEFYKKLLDEANILYEKYVNECGIPEDVNYEKPQKKQPQIKEVADVEPEQDHTFVEDTEGNTEFMYDKQCILEISMVIHNETDKLRRFIKNTEIESSDKKHSFKIEETIEVPAQDTEIVLAHATGMGYTKKVIDDTYRFPELRTSDKYEFFYGTINPGSENCYKKPTPGPTNPEKND